MPFLIRFIAQRILVYALGFLAFLGFNPDIAPPTNEEVIAFEQEQNEAIENVLSKDLENVDTNDSLKIENKTNEIVKQVQSKQQNTQTQVEKIINSPQISVERSGYSIKENFFEDVIVNIVCVNKGSNFIKMTTGSGVIVSSSGIVLTNTHVANTFLFDDKSKSSYKKCTIKRENIPTYGFNAELVYLSDEWLTNNQDFFMSDNPRGNGENDFALLAITTNTNPSLSVPSDFPHAELILDEFNINEGDIITAAAYPGVNSGVFELDSNANLKESKTYIDELMTFKSKTIDLISTGPNDVAKRGSSGGGVFKGYDLLGIIVTTDDVGNGSYINALTLPYINREFLSNTGIRLTNYLSSEKTNLINNYKDEISKLKRLVANFL